MYGDLGIKLVNSFKIQLQRIPPMLTAIFPQVQHAKRTQTLVGLPPYQTDLVRNIVREVRALDSDVNSLLAPFAGSFNPAAEPAVACALLVDHLSMRRNKRCLLAYHRVRAEKIEEAVWAGKDPLESWSGTSNQGSADMAEGAAAAAAESSNLSPEEEEYARAYGELLAAYKGKWTDIDLTGSLEPPRDLFVDVRVLKDAGEIQTEYGYFVFHEILFWLRKLLTLSAVPSL